MFRAHSSTDTTTGGLTDFGKVNNKVVIPIDGPAL